VCVTRRPVVQWSEVSDRPIRRRLGRRRRRRRRRRDTTTI